MGDGRPDFRSKPHTDIPADLSDKDRFALIAHRGVPEAQVIALMDIVARLLAGEILAAAFKVKRTHRRIPVARPEQKGLDRLPHGGGIGFFGRKPAPAGESGGDVLKVADDDKIEGIAECRTFLIGGAAGQCFQRRFKPFLIDVYYFLVRVEAVEIQHAVIYPHAGNLDEEGKEFDLFTGDKVDLDHLFTFVEIGVDEPRYRRIGPDRVFEACRTEMAFHLIAIDIEKTTPHGIHHFQRGEAVRIRGLVKKIEGLLALVFNLHPDRLNFFFDQVNVEQGPDFLGGGNGHRHTHIGVRLRYRPVAEADRVDGFRVVGGPCLQSGAAGEHRRQKKDGNGICGPPQPRH